MNKKMLLAIVKGLITTEGATQFYEGVRCIKGEDKIQTLLNAINLLPE